MPCGCLSPRKKQTSRSAPPLQTEFAPQPRQYSRLFSEPSSPFLKFSRLTLLSRIEKAFSSTPSESERVNNLISQIQSSENVWCTRSQTGAPALEIDLPLPIRPESILHPGLSNFDEKNNSDFSRNICKRRQYGPPRELVLDIIPDPGAVASPLITPSFPRHSHQAILSETNRDVQDFIDPLPTPELSSPSEALQDPLPKPPNSPPQSSISDLSMGSSSTLGFIQHATILKPRLAELQTPPPTPPPNLPLPPLPLPRAFLPNRASSLASVVISVDQDGRILQSMANTRKTGVYEARSLTQSTYRPRSKSSPLKPQPMPNKILEKKPSERRV
ncbi:hypothetical protein BY996DRAFT_4508894 [Phakopsora pachyrhizi]|nr:hypothetical protein BY996DRAFT_4508894 [Phakopsora pachyrhizi]